MNEKEHFYTTVATLLQTHHTYEERRFSYKTRWNNRDPGNGRYQGHGIVRMFGANAVHVSLHNPPVNKMCKSTDEALEVIQNVLGPQRS